MTVLSWSEVKCLQLSLIHIYTEEELVSSDIIGMEYGSLFDATQTLAQRCGTKIYEVRVVAWYDNESSYVCQMIRTLKYMASLI